LDLGVRPMHLSTRAAAGPPNALAIARADAAARGIAITDLTDSNPTRHGLTDPSIMDVIARHLSQATRYTPDPKGWRPAREALAARYGGRPDDYWLTASTSEAYSWLFAALCDAGDSVAVPVPGYPLIEPLARLSAIVQKPYRAFYVHPHGWELDVDSVSAALTAPRVRALVTVNPNNPTGAYIRPEVGRALGEMCAKVSLPIIADEVFFPYDLDADFTSPHKQTRDPVATAWPLDALPYSHRSRAPQSLVPRNALPAAPTSTSKRTRLADAVGPDTVVATLDGLSKLLAAPQLKLGWIRLTGPSDMTAPLAATLDAIADTYLSVNSPVACALPSLLQLADDTVERVRRRCRADLDALSFLGDGFRARRTEGGWTALLDVPPVMDDDEFARWLLRAGLTAHPGWFYDVAGNSVIAVSLLPEPTVFTHCLRPLGAISLRAPGGNLDW